MGILPSGYTGIEYLESTGSQAIDTGVKTNENTVIEVEFTPVDFGTDKTIVFGSADAVFGNGIDFYCGDGVSWTVGYPGWYAGADNVFSVGDRLLAIIKSGTSSVEKIGTSQKTEWPLALPQYESANNLHLFCIFRNGMFFGKTRIHSVKVYKKETLERDMVSCINNATNEAGMYDFVSNQFYANVGTGSFISGPELFVPDSPADFYQAKVVFLRWTYVECDGYRLYKNGSLICETTETFYIDESVSSGQDIEYSVTAYKGGIESEPHTITVQIREGYTILTPVITTAFFQ